MKIPKKRKIQDEVDHILERLSTMEVDSEEYWHAADNLRVLYEAKAIEHSYRNTWVVAGTTILEIALVLYHERLFVISSKAFNLILKGHL